MTGDAPDWTGSGGAARPAEVRELWSFVHGDIMAPGIRQQLRRAFGFCPRHTWMYAAVEIELWQGGVGSSPGHQPFDVCVLYDGLLGVALDGLRHRRWRWGAADPRRALRAQSGCRVCASVARAEERGDGASWGFAGSDSVALTREVNALTHTRRWLEDTAAVWHAASCALCVTSDGPRGARALTCRPHLIEGGADTDADDLFDRLAELRDRLDGLLDSMHAGRRVDATASQRASWIETLAFFSGWQTPLTLAAPTPRPPRGVR
jgi:hypothetical protein